ncbi:MAG: NupC/NupG family nucleoside CNT transporter, partial [Gemmatimonadetes bacterium]|nr:NupC/NupG family nucleoside CNT transporter [Gemmatimonadota bacterium]
YVDAGSSFVFGDAFSEHFFAFKVLPTIIFFSALMGVLYHLGLVQYVVVAFASVMQRTLRTSGAESLAAAANVFVGQTEAPLVVRPYVASMTRSELMALMVGGFATIAGGVLAAFVGLGIDAGHLVAASVISAPAALLVAKIMQPEVEESKTLGRVSIEVERTATNVVEAAANSTLDGLRLALNVAAMLIAALGLIALVDGALGLLGQGVGYILGLEGLEWSLSAALGYLFAPFAWLMGIEAKDCLLAGELLGKKMVANEFVSYVQLSQWIQPDSGVELSQRSVIILTYALCGFANFSSIGIQIGGIGGIAPERRRDLARLGFRAMLGGSLACFMTACVAGILL